MGTAILAGVLKSCVATKASGETPRFSKFIATTNSEKSQKSLAERLSEYSDILHVTRDNDQAIARADVILLAFKPYMIEQVLRNDAFQKTLKNKLILSVLVGSPTSKIEAAVFGHDSKYGKPAKQPLYLKRAMPNIGAAYGQSMTVIETDPSPTFTPSSIYEDTTDWIFSQIGIIQHVPPHLFDVSGVLAGASGALLSVAFDGILDGAVSQGLKRADATAILTQSLVSLATLLQNGEHPAVLREKFSSPMGTTIAGLMSLEEDRARWAYGKATIKSSERSKEIGGQE